LAEEEGIVRRETIGRISKITIANPMRKNAITPRMMGQLSDALTDLDENDGLWVGVICADGDHFTAGLDMTRFFGPSACARPLPADAVDPLGLGRQCRKPIITAVHGICYTVGLEIMLAGDIVVASTTARFSQMEPRRGIAPLGGAHFRYLTRTGWGDAMYHLLLADEFDAERAYKIGLVQEVVPPGEETMRAMQLAELIAANAPIGVQATKAAARTFIEQGEAAAIAAVPGIRAKVLGSEDAAEGLESFVQRRQAAFAGR